MVYASEQRANEIAERLNGRYGYPLSKAVLTEFGWEVISDYKFGSTKPTPEQNAAYRQTGWAVKEVR